MNDGDIDFRVRHKAFEFLKEQTGIHGDILPWSLLQRGFEFEGRRVPLVSMNGIFKPAIMPLAPLTLRTAPPNAENMRRYDDEIGSDGSIEYRFRDGDAGLGDNNRLRIAMRDHLPLIYLFGVSEGRYRPVWPAFVMADNAITRSVTLRVDDPAVLIDASKDLEYSEIAPRRRYVTTLVQRRLHQQLFREQVINAYRVRCAICRLQHDELLEAAHIIPDSDPEGVSTVPNGISLCTIHHAAYDRNILGIRPDYTVQVRKDILDEVDGPMLKHGLQEFQDAKLGVPHPAALRPNPAFLERRFASFLAARL